MKYPQDLAVELVPNILEIAKNGCLAMCYLYCAGIDKNDAGEYLRLISHYMNIGVLDRDAFVLDADKLLFNLTGRKTNVSKVTISNINVIKEATPVLYEYRGRSHWVVVENGKIVFNSLSNSLCVKEGKPTAARVIEWKK